ncbi:hypothetical protein D3C77_366290 [compost metagenome]
MYPRGSSDDWNGGATYGTPYTILCGWAAKNQQARDNDGAEFTSASTIWTEDDRPQYLDRIAFGDTTAQTWDAAASEEIRSRTFWEMAAFNDVPDYMLLT